MSTKFIKREFCEKFGCDESAIKIVVDVSEPIDIMRVCGIHALGALDDQLIFDLMPDEEILAIIETHNS